MRSGTDYLESIAAPRKVYIDGDHVSDVPGHPAFAGAARTLAGLFDRANEPERNMLYSAPETGSLALRPFMVPRSRDELGARREAITQWADLSQGFIGRGPDHVASFFAGFAGGSEVFDSDDGGRGENVRGFYRRILDESLYLSYTILPPQFDRSTTASGWSEEYVQAGVADEGEHGIIIRGAMALGTGAPLSDYLFVSCIKPLGDGDENYANSFVVPIAAEGLRLICRRAYAPAAPSSFDYPLSTRFDESDAFAVFDDVFVPWEHVFVLRDPGRLREQFYRTPAHVLGNTQAQIRFVVKLKFMLGVARSITAVNGTDRLPPVQEKLGELAALASSVEGMLLAAEATSAKDEFGVERPNARFLYGIMATQAELYPRVVNILRDLSGVGVMQLPSHASDLDDAEIGGDVRRFIRSSGTDADERIKLFKLAWELVGSEFAGRHQHYEMFYAGAPFVTRGYAFRNYGYDEPLDRVKAFLSSYERTDNASTTDRVSPADR